MGTGTLPLVTDVSFCIKSSRRQEFSAPSPYCRVPALAEGTSLPIVLECTFAVADRCSSTAYRKSLHSGREARTWLSSGELHQCRLLSSVLGDTGTMTPTLVMIFVAWTTLMTTTVTGDWCRLSPSLILGIGTARVQAAGECFL